MNLSEIYHNRLLQLSGLLTEETRIEFLKKDFMDWANKFWETNHESIETKTLNQAKYLKMQGQLVDAFIAADPSVNKQYSRWLLNLVKKNSLQMEDLYKATEYLELFDKVKSRLPIELRDINKYTDLPNLYNSIKNYQKEEVLSTTQKTKIEKLEGADRIIDNNNWLILVPKTEEASCLYGKDTQWCTAAGKSSNRFQYYNKQGPLFILINKAITDNARVNPFKKLQFHFESKTFMDANDHSIDITDFFNKNRELIDVFEKIGKIDTAFKMKYRLLPKNEALKYLEDSVIRTRLIQEYGIKWFVDYFKELRIIKSLKELLANDEELIKSILSKNELSELVEALSDINENVFSAELLYSNKNILKYFKGKNASLEQLNKYIELLAKTGKQGKEYVKELTVNSDEVYDIFKSKKKVSSFYNLIAKSNVLGNEGLTIVYQLLQDPTRKKDYFETEGKDAYNIMFEFIKLAMKKPLKELKESFKDIISSSF